MTKLTPLLPVLLFLAIITSSDHEVSSAEVDGGGPGAVVCDIVFEMCLGSCWKSGECMRCCKHHGFVHGRCSLKHGDGCYCCHIPD
ncbi:unnamed protein product [Urochloa decumbens]|uniref:Uncharacterized protein n=1 Tax=Urochloa decumbens TaxID=240449 RepID=A0ABC9CEG9_9POAL